MFIVIRLWSAARRSGILGHTWKWKRHWFVRTMCDTWVSGGLVMDDAESDGCLGFACCSAFGFTRISRSGSGWVDGLLGTLTDEVALLDSQKRGKKRKRRDTSNGVASEEAPLRQSPRIGYLSSCSPTQELHQKSVMLMLWLRKPT